MFTPVDPAIKEKVIASYLAGNGKKGRNQITREMHEQGIQVSHGSISNIIARYKREQSQTSSVKGRMTETSSINVADDSNIVGPPSSSSGVGLAGDINIDNPGQEIDFDNQPYETTADTLLADADYNEALDGESGERLLNYTTVEAEPEQVESDARYDNHVVKETKKIKESTATKESDQLRSRISDTKDSSLGLDMDWDAGHQTRFVKWVLQQKRSRQYERGRLDIHWKRLGEERKRFEEQKKELEAASADLAQRIVNVKDLIPIAAELKQIGLDFSLATSWLTCVKEMATRKGLDLRSAACKLAEDLKAWQELGGFETAIYNAKHQLSLLDMAIEDKKAAIGTLVDFRKMGMSEAEVLKLVKVVNGWGNNNGNGFELDDALNLQDQNC